MYDTNEDVEDEFEQNETDADIQEHHKKKRTNNFTDIDLMGGMENENSNIFKIPNYGEEVDRKIKNNKSGNDNPFNPDNWNL